MTIPTQLAGLTGHWLGTSQLWLSPDDPARESESTLVVAPAAQDRFLTFRYTWSDEGAPQDGLLLLSQDGDAVDAAWIDSWHMANKIMSLNGAVDAAGGVMLHGSYAAPPGPDWGWRIELTSTPDDTCELRMYNVTPDGEAFLAVEAVYMRVP